MILVTHMHYYEVDHGNCSLCSQWREENGAKANPSVRDRCKPVFIRFVLNELRRDKNPLSVGRRIWRPLSPRGDDVWRLRPGWGWGGCTAWRAQPRIKVREQRDLPAAVRLRRAAAPRDADHTRKALGIRLPETRAQVNNWWRLIRPRTKLCGKPAHPIPSGFGSFCQGRDMRVQRDLWAPLRVFHLGRGSGPFCLPATLPSASAPAFSSLLKIASLWLLLPGPPLQSRPLPCPGLWGQLMNISALPGERLARRGTSRVCRLRAAAPARQRTPKESFALPAAESPRSRHCLEKASGCGTGANRPRVKVLSQTVAYTIVRSETFLVSWRHNKSWSPRKIRRKELSIDFKKHRLC